MNKNRNRKAISYTILIFLVILMVGLAFLIPSMAKSYKAKQDEKIIKNLESIYTSAVVVDGIGGGLHNDSDNAGTYKELSSRTGFQIYNSPQDKGYYLLKDYKTGKIVVWYGKKLRYPSETAKEKIANNNLENLKTEDLFTYNESEGVVQITGFSQQASSALNAGSVIQLPDSYKGRTVSAVADKAFSGKNIMGTVVIPSTIKDMGENSFSNNGEKRNSNSIPKPYTGSWKVVNGKWEKLN